MSDAHISAITEERSQRFASKPKTWICFFFRWLLTGVTVLTVCIYLDIIHDLTVLQGKLKHLIESCILEGCRLLSMQTLLDCI